MLVANTWESVSLHAKRVGAKFPELVAAQWALESGFGKSVSGKHNYFGLKGIGSSRETKEFYDGEWVTIKAGFIDFPSLAACIEYLVVHWYKDWQAFKGINRAENRYAAARMLKEQSYATDPDYPAKLSRLMKQYAPDAPIVPLPMALIGPKKRPQNFGFKAGDSHLIVNDASERMKAFSFEGKLLWEVDCLARGQGSDFEWKLRNTDTPPGLYKVGTIYRDYEINGDKPRYDRTLMAYGWYSLDLIELENQEAKYNRAGIMIHGGGSGNGWPGAWAPKQSLLPTHGCVRLHNIDLRDKVIPLLKTGAIFVSVYQEG
jgi:lipoprotein-anchoring transpeptidase ErfK/SrfK